VIGALVASALAVPAVATAVPASVPFATVSGRLILPPGVDPDRMTEIQIWAHPVGGTTNFIDRPAADGTYRVQIAQPSVIAVVPPSDTGLVTEYYGGAHRRSLAQVVRPDADLTGADVTLDVGGTVSGGLVAPPGVAANLWWLRATNVDDPQGPEYQASVTADGSYTLRAMPTGRYRVQFVGPGVEYWKDADSEEDATLVPVTLGRATTGIDPVVHVTTTVNASVAAQIVPVGTPVRVYVSVWSRYSVPVVGSVEVVDGADRVLGREPLDDRAMAEVSVTDLPPGRHELRVRLPGDETYAPSSDTVVVWVVGPTALTVSRVEPSSGPAHVGAARDIWVDIAGTGFTLGTTALVDGQPVHTVVVSPTGLRARVPRGAVGTVDVAVRDGDTTSPAAPGARFTWTTALGRTPTRILDSTAPGSGCASVGFVSDAPSGEITGVWLNVTAVGPTGSGYVVVGPGADGDAGTLPELTGSTVNFEPGKDVANSAYVPVSRTDQVCYRTAGAPVRVLLDVTGYTVKGSGVTAAPSTRILDTRPGGVGEIDGPVAPRTLHTVKVAGRAGVPADATSVMLNVTVTGPRAPGNLRVFPGGQTVPTTSVLNYAPGQDKANAATVQLVDGSVSFWSDTSGSASASPVHVLLDVVGWTTPGSALTSVPPTRVLDTRAASRVGPIAQPLLPRTGTSFSVTGTGVVPAGATAVLLNVTATGLTAMGNLRVFPDHDGTGAGQPPTGSVLNYIEGRDIPNQVLVELPANGRVTLYSDRLVGATDVIVDVVGYVG